MAKAKIKKYHGVSCSVNSSQPSRGRFAKAPPPKAFNMAELATERERSRQSYVDQLLSMCRLNACVLADNMTNPQVSIPVKSAYSMNSIVLNSCLTIATCLGKTLGRSVQVRGS